jgi:hypothetical protein
MKISLSKPAQNQAGMAVIVVIGILSIILIFVAGNLRTLYLLRNDLRLVERQQTNRLASVGLVMNPLPLTNGLPGTGELHTSPGAQPK